MSETYTPSVLKPQVAEQLMLPRHACPVKLLLGHAYQALLEADCLVGVHLNDQASPAFQRQPQNQAPTFFSHFHWTVTGSRFHGRHQEFPFS